MNPAPALASVALPGPSAAPSAEAGFAAALRATAAGAPAAPVPPIPGPPVPTRPAAPSPPGSAASAAREVLHAIERAQRRLDAVLEAGRRGRTFTAQELLVLQAEAYRCAQTLDVASKAVEHAAQSVRQAANTQV